jgi:L-asparaginase
MLILNCEKLGSGQVYAADVAELRHWTDAGRLGDSPVIGTGSYVDSRYGAAACTNTGDIVIRTAASWLVVLYMKMVSSGPQH